MAVREGKRCGQQPDPGADHQGHREHLVALPGGCCGREPVGQRIALSRRREQNPGPGQRRQAVSRQQEAGRVECDQQRERDRRRDRPAAGQGEVCGQRQRGDGRRSQRPGECGSRGRHERHQERQADGDERREAVPVVERIVQARPRFLDHLRRLERREPGGLEPREEGDARDDRGTARNAADHAPQAVAPLHGQREHEHAH